MVENHDRNLIESYTPSTSKKVRQACLEVAVKLGDFIEDICVVGGLVPSLIIDQDNFAGNAERHLGTLDLDLGFSMAVLDQKLYEGISVRLSDAGFSPDTNEQSNMTTHRWRSSEGITVDFLIPPTSDEDRGGRLRNLKTGFAAIITPGLDLAFIDFELVLLREVLPGAKGQAERRIKVCGPGAFAVLKALAFGNRGKPKDAYDLFYVLLNHDKSVSSIAERIRSFGDHPQVVKAIDVLNRDFQTSDLIGPTSVTRFLGRDEDHNLRADVAGVVRDLLARLS